MIKAQARLDRDPALAGARLILTVHDELVFEVPEAGADALIAAARHEMAEAMTLDVPLVVDVAKGHTWADIH
jgi:DNA polymerase-1